MVKPLPRHRTDLDIDHPDVIMLFLHLETLQYYQENNEILSDIVTNVALPTCHCVQTACLQVENVCRNGTLKANRKLQNLLGKDL